MKNEEKLKRIYDTLFSTNYLINYGYFDITPNSDHLNHLTSYGKSDAFYLKVFNMSKLANYVTKNHSNINKLLKTSKIYSTEPISFTIPKNNISRREYKILNIYSYLLLMFFIQNNKESIQGIFLQNKFSTSKFFSLADFDFNFTDKLKKSLLFGGKHILNLDLSNFYHSLYTHSIPWVIMGKKEAKRNKDTGFSNELDFLIRSCQYNQTHGIPTGNTLSRIITELYMCHIDSKMESQGYKYARYVDDISFPFNFEEEKDKFYRDFNKLCMEYELNINDKKTTINDFPFIHTQNKDIIFNYFKNYNSYTKDKNWIKGIKNFIDLCIDEERKGNKGSIKCVFTVLENAFRYKKIGKKKITKIFSYNDKITGFSLLKFLLDLSLKDSKLTNRFLSLMNYLSNKIGSKMLIEKHIKEYFEYRKNDISELLIFYNKNNYHQELYQVLIYTVEYDIDFMKKKNTLLLINENTDDLSLSLLTIIYLRKGWKIKDLIKKTDCLFKNSTNSYPKNVGRMSQKMWFFRYFFYYLMQEDLIKKRDVNKYCSSKNYAINNKGYKTELNWKYINSNDPVDSFFNMLLEDRIPLVDLKYVGLK